MKKQVLFAALFLIPIGVHADDPLKKVAAELADGIAKVKDAHVAVLAVPHHDSHPSEGPFVVSERLATFLVMDKRLSVLERNHIVQILDELHLSETGVLDLKSAQRVGQALGANVIVTGTLIDLEKKKSELNVRALYADTGQIIAASRTTLDQNWQSRPMLHKATSRKSVLDWSE